MKTKIPIACAALALLTPSVGEAMLVWRAPMAPSEAPLQIESHPDGLAITRPDGLRLTLSGRPALAFAPTFCARGDRRFLAIATTNEQGRAGLWVWDHHAYRGRLFTLPAPIATRPAANSDCTFGVVTTHGALHTIDPMTGANEWVAEVIPPVRDMSEHHGGLFLSHHDQGWVVGGEGSVARVLREGGDVVAALDAPLRPGAVTGADGLTWALSRRGALYVIGPEGVRQVAQGDVAPTTSLVPWEGVGLAWGDALGRLVTFDGATLSTTPLSQRSLSRTLLTSSSPEGHVALVPTSDGWVYSVRPDKTWTRARFEAPLRGPAITSDTHGVTLTSPSAPTHVIDITAPIDHLEDGEQAELLANTTRASMGHVLTSRGVELLDGAPHTSFASVILNLPTELPDASVDMKAPAPPEASTREEDIVVVVLDGTPATSAGCAVGHTGAPAPLTLFGLLGLVGFALRRSRQRE